MTGWEFAAASWAASWWVDLIAASGQHIIVPIVVAAITAIATPLVAAWIARTGIQQVGEEVGKVDKKVDKVVSQVTNGDAPDAPKLRKDIDWQIAQGTETLAAVADLRAEFVRQFGGLRDEMRGGFDRVESDASEERENRRRADAQLAAQIAALERPA